MFVLIPSLLPHFHVDTDTSKWGAAKKNHCSPNGNIFEELFFKKGEYLKEKNITYVLKGV